MKQINWSNVALFVVFATFLVFPLAGAAETILIFRSDASIQLKLIIAGVWVAMTIPLAVVVVLTLRRRRQ
jgi:uncharacterized membrane protein